MSATCRTYLTSWRAMKCNIEICWLSVRLASMEWCRMFVVADEVGRYGMCLWSKYGLIYHHKNITELQSVQMDRMLNPKTKWNRVDLHKVSYHLKHFVKSQTWRECWSCGDNQHFSLFLYALLACVSSDFNVTWELAGNYDHCNLKNVWPIPCGTQNIGINSRIGSFEDSYRCQWWWYW